MAKKPSPKPVALAGYVLIFLTFGVLGSWAAVAKLDSAVVAPGTISLEGNRRVVQHFEGGIVEEILVTEADAVQEGDVLVRLSSVEAQSNLGVLSSRLDVARMIEARLLAERKLADEIEFPEELVSGENPIVTAVRDDQLDLFREGRSILKSQEDILRARMGQIEVQIEGLELQRSAFERRIDNYTEMLTRMRDGESRGLIQGNVLSQREDELIEIEANLGQVISDIAQARAFDSTLSQAQRMLRFVQRPGDRDDRLVDPSLVSRTEFGHRCPSPADERIHSECHIAILSRRHRR